MADELYIGALKIKGFSGSIQTTLTGYICGVDIHFAYSDELYLYLRFKHNHPVFLRFGEATKLFILGQGHWGYVFGNKQMWLRL